MKEISFSMVNQLTTIEQHFLIDGFREDSIEKVGHDGEIRPFFISAKKDKNIVGLLTGSIFWGDLQIKNLVVSKKYRGKKIGKRLVEMALEFGREQGLKFSTVSTMNFQAKDFYMKLGYEVEFERKGYDCSTSVIYLRKDFLKRS